MTKGTRGASTSVLGRTFNPKEYIYKYFNTLSFHKNLGREAIHILVTPDWSQY